MRKIGELIRRIATPMAVLVLASVVIHDHIQSQGPPKPRPAVNGRALGRAYAPTAASTLGDGWVAAADALEAGKAVSEAQSAFQAAYQQSRARAFSAKVAPEFARVLPEGQEPSGPAQRAEVVRLWREFAAGLKGGR